MPNRLSPPTLWGYGIGDFGQNLAFQTLAIFLLPFYTEVLGLSPALAGLIFLIARPIDGLTDPLMGFLAQRYRSRWGSFRPFLLYGALPVGLSFVLLFYEPALGPTGNFVYAFGSYLLFGLCFTAVNIPYGALTAVLTTDYQERSKLTAYRMSFALLGGILAGYGTPVLLDQLDTHFGMAALYASLLVMGLLITFWTVREEVPKLPPARENLGLTFRMLRQNHPFWQLAVAFGSCFAALMVFSGTAVYYFTHYVGEGGNLGTAFLCFTVATAASVPAWNFAVKRIGKRKSFLLGIGLSILAFLIAYTLSPTKLLPLYLLFALHGIGNGAAALTSWAMPADTIEYGQWKSGISATGMTYGVYGVVIKLGMGIGASLVGLALSLVGYEANQTQTPEAVQGIRALQTLLPAGFLLIAWATMWFYPLTEKRHGEIRGELEAQNTEP